MRSMHYAVASLALAVSIGCSQDTGTAIAAPQLDQESAASGPSASAHGNWTSPAGETVASGPSASGHGNWINPAGEYVSRSFQGRKQDGVVRGEFVQWITALNGDRRPNKGDINCLRLISPQDAVLSGPITDNLNPALIGQTQIFRVYDDGEGADAVDRMGPLSFRTPESGLNCQNFTPPDGNVTPIESGNIQVRP